MGVTRDTRNKLSYLRANENSADFISLLMRWLQRGLQLLPVTGRAACTQSSASVISAAAAASSTTMLLLDCGSSSSRLYSCAPGCLPGGTALQLPPLHQVIATGQT